MMNKITCIISGLALAVSPMVQARQLSVSEAVNRAQGQTICPEGVKRIKANVKAEYVNQCDGVNCWYVIKQGDGFSIIAADDVAAPVLGYVEHGEFDYATLPDNMKGWLDIYTRQISTEAHETDSKAFAAQLPGKGNDITPMLTTKWAQERPFNNLCPLDNGRRSFTGCVATALTQIMNYHKWPEYNPAKNTWDGTNENLLPDYSNVSFDWSKMKDYWWGTNTPDEENEIARLSYAVGRSVGMNYSASGSGAPGRNVVPAITNYWGYDKNACYLTRDMFNSTTWKELLTQELVEGRPVLYIGFDENGSGAGHAFVMDGYQASTGYYHINWGWAGGRDGWFAIDALNPDASHYNKGCCMVTGMQKPGLNPRPMVMIDGGVVLDVTKYASTGQMRLMTGRATSATTQTQGKGFKNLASCPNEVEIGLELRDFQSEKVMKQVKIADYAFKKSETVSAFAFDARGIFDKGEWKVIPLIRFKGETEWKNMVVNSEDDGYGWLSIDKNGTIDRLTPRRRCFPPEMDWEYIGEGELIDWITSDMYSGARCVYTWKLTSHSLQAPVYQSASQPGYYLLKNPFKLLFDLDWTMVGVTYVPEEDFVAIKAVDPMECVIMDSSYGMLGGSRDCGTFTFQSYAWKSFKNDSTYGDYPLGKLEGNVMTFPKDCIEGYGWYNKTYTCNTTGNLKVILPTGTPTLIRDIEGTREDEKYYDLCGREVCDPKNGIFIRVRNGKSEKVLL